ncbi:MAG: hypothetical protein L0H29_00195 [Sinobacteraceae bacterium]|nr:hypothetical protein [Nevskiaceae bacterium]
MNEDHDDEEQRQKSVSLRFQTKDLWPHLRREFGVDQTGAAIILDICHHHGELTYSRTARHYDLPGRYRNPLYTWRKVVSAVDHLDATGIIHHDRRPPGERGWQSALSATDELRAICADIIGGRRLILAKRPELILLRDKQRKLVDYQGTRHLDRMRRKIEYFNEAILGANLDPTIAAPLARIFNRDFKRGGRFYAMGASWQNIKSEARQSLQINGEPVVELDYCTLHPGILYAEAQAQMPSDCYDLDGWPRKLVKVAMLTLINAKTKQTARMSIAHNDLMGELAELGSQDAMRMADTLIDSIKRKHRPIADSFHSDAGARLMGIDAAMAEMVMNIMLSRGIVVLPVHDSFLVPASKADDLEAAMLEAAYRAGFEALRVEAK